MCKHCRGHQISTSHHQMCRDLAIRISVGIWTQLGMLSILRSLWLNQLGLERSNYRTFQAIESELARFEPGLESLSSKDHLLYRLACQLANFFLKAPHFDNNLTWRRLDHFSTKCQSKIWHLLMINFQCRFLSKWHQLSMAPVCCTKWSTTWCSHQYTKWMGHTSSVTHL